MSKKIRKFISSNLILGVMFSNIININSFAVTSSSDIRYETFEGSDIAIDDVLEANEINVELEGNTLVNIHSKYTPYLNVSSGNIDGYTIESEENYIKVVGDNPSLDWLYVHFGNLNINMFKPNTTYTIVFSKLKGVDYIAFHTGVSTSPIANHIEVVDGQLVYVINTYENITDDTQVLYLGLRNTAVDLEVENPMIIEGDLSKNPPKGYFEGMQSVGQDDIDGHNINILSSSENLFNYEEYYKYFPSTKTDDETILSHKGDLKGGNHNVGFLSPMKINLKPNTKYTLCAFNLSDSGQILQLEGCLSDKKQSLGMNVAIGAIGYKVFTTNNTNYKDGISFKINTSVTGEKARYQIMIVEGDRRPSSYTHYSSNEKGILLNKPLRGLPNGVKDRFVKINGKWFIERNCKFELLTENTQFTNYYASANYIGFRLFMGGVSVPNGNSADNILCDNLKSIATPYGVQFENYKEGVSYYYESASSSGVIIVVAKDKLSTLDVNGLKKWLSTNNIQIVYPTKPTYEPLEIVPLINTYIGTTFISNDSKIPTSMKTIVDRTANIANKYIQIAKTNPTIENISMARMWISLLKESTLKDQMQDDVTNIIQVEDLEIERKKASVNLDLYIKTKNTLSLSLDTNSITFDNYSGVEDVEMLNAVNLTVNSSLPYSLNAYMEDGFYNSDKTNSLEVNSLNIRENTDTVYKQFTNIKEKLILKDNCDEGNEKYHVIDFKLSGSNAHKTDVYKTVIKFEVEQK